AVVHMVAGSVWLIVALLLVLVVLTGIAILQLHRLSRSRENVAHVAVDLRTRLEVLAAHNADFERDMRQDSANARAEQTLASQTARTELTATLAYQAQVLQQQLASMASAQAEQWQHFSERLLQQAQANERRFEAVRSTIEQRLDVMRS